MQNKKYLFLIMCMLVSVFNPTTAFAFSEADITIIWKGGDIEGEKQYQISVEVTDTSANDSMVFILDEGLESQVKATTNLYKGKNNRVLNYKSIGDKQFPTHVSIVIGNKYYLNKAELDSVIGIVTTRKSLEASITYENVSETVVPKTTPSPVVETVVPKTTPTPVVGSSFPSVENETLETDNPNQESSTILDNAGVSPITPVYIFIVAVISCIGLILYTRRKFGGD